MEAPTEISTKAAILSHEYLVSNVFFIVVLIYYAKTIAMRAFEMARHGFILKSMWPILYSAVSVALVI
jgi:hypothetical protein